MPSSLSLHSAFSHLISAEIISKHLMPGSQLTQASYPGAFPRLLQLGFPQIRRTNYPPQHIFYLFPDSRIALQDTPQKQVLGCTDSYPQVPESQRQPPGLKF